MKKVFAAILCVMVLCGCESRDADLNQRVFDELEHFSGDALSIGSNRNKRYYSYYLPQGIKQRDANDLSEVLVKDGYRMVMNFDPGIIVINNYYAENADAESTASLNPQQAAELTAVSMDSQGDQTIYSSHYRTVDHEVFPYTLRLMKTDGNYLVYLDGSLVKLYTYLPAAAVPSALKAMYSLMTSISYDKERVLEDFSLKSLAQTKQENLDYTQSHLPSSGSLEDLINPKQDHTGTGDVIQEEQTKK